MKRYYSCALITGASAGLGEEFAKQLAGRVDKLVLVARREQRLEQLAAKIRKRYPQVAVLVIAANLADPGERVAVCKNLKSSGFVPDLLINNAGLGDYGLFATADWENQLAMLKVNIEALTHLTHMIVPEMRKRGAGAIMNVSSLASTLPLPDMAVYAATKAYVSSFTEALRIELKEDGIQVMALCPGPVHTEFGKVARREGSSEGMTGHALFVVSKKQVVREGLRGLDQSRARVFPGFKIAAAGLIIGAIPMVLLRIVLSTRPRR